MVAEQESSENTTCSSPIPSLKYLSNDLLINLTDCSEERKLSGFKSKLLKQWELSANKGTLNYHVGNCKFRKLDGQYKICLQLNEDRCRKRRKPMEFNSVCQPFDEGLWNFTKLKQEECLFYMDKIKENSISSQHSPEGLVSINASPLSVGHSLLIPSPQKCLPQILCFEAIKMSIELLLLIEDDNFLIIYNGLMAHASVNHLHLQTLFWPCKSGILEKAVKPKSTGWNWLFLLQRPDWYLPAFVFQLDNYNDIEKVTKTLDICVKLLIENGVAHNLFMCRSKQFINRVNKAENISNNTIPKELVTIYLFPRKASKEGLFVGGSLTSTFVPAALEVAGLLPVYDSDFFNSTNESEILKIFNERELMSDEYFEQLASKLINYLIEDEF
uniref:GDP-D-glucose phosphorylase 1 n=1 Tax=Meloidogyne incognita TaxID=6306 RepID=A0A914NDC4_MELIC